MPAEVVEKISREPRMKIKHLAPEVRCRHYGRISRSAMTRKRRSREAGRCRGCGGGAVVDTEKVHGLSHLPADLPLRRTGGHVRFRDTA